MQILVLLKREKRKAQLEDEEAWLLSLDDFLDFCASFFDLLTNLCSNLFFMELMVFIRLNVESMSIF